MAEADHSTRCNGAEAEGRAGCQPAQPGAAGLGAGREGRRTRTVGLQHNATVRGLCGEAMWFKLPARTKLRGKG